MGLSAIIVGTMVAILVGMITDRIKGKMKITILALLIAGKTVFIAEINRLSLQEV